jgi:4-amino-4-deoxy-L-arabinose transferase-like glycosyltransferase
MTAPVPSTSNLVSNGTYRSSASTGEGARASITDESSRSKIYFALAALCILRLWIMPMTSSLWLDETTTYWSAYKGIGAAVSRSQFWPGQNVLYSVIAATAIRLGGHSELVLRLPSLLAALAAAWLLFRLGTRLFDRETAALSAVVFVSLHEVFEAAANARPYALGLLFVVASTWELVRWLDSGRKRDLLLYVLLAAAVPYFHYLFATIFIVHGIYAGYRIRLEAYRRVSEAALAAVAVLVLLTPLAWNASHGKHISMASSFTGTPDFQKLFSVGMPAVLATGILLGLLLGYSLYRKLNAEHVVEPAADTLLLLITWFVVPILVMFAVSRVSGFKVFVSRYYLPAFPALSLLVGWGIRNLAEKVRVVVIACVAVAAIASFGTHHLWVNPYLEDWRGAAKEIRAANLGQNTPVLVRTGLIETAKPTWDPELDRDSPLLAPLSKYPVPGHILLVPSGISEEGVRYMNDLSSRFLDATPEFVYLARDAGDPYQAWLLGRYSSQFVASKLGHPDGVSVFLFRRVSH